MDLCAGDQVLERYLVERGESRPPPTDPLRNWVYRGFGPLPTTARVVIRIAPTVLMPGQRLADSPLGQVHALLGRLAHPGLPRPLELGLHDGHPTLIVSWSRGRTLTRVASTLTAAERLEVARQLAQALLHLEQHGVLHRDIKPGNVLIQRGAGGVETTLLDLDFAHLLGHDSVPAGSAGWAAPEVYALEPAWLDHRADLYGLGTTLYFLFTGRARFPPSPHAVRQQHLDGGAGPAPADVTPAAWRIVDRLLQADRRQRFASAREVLAALAALPAEAAPLPRTPHRLPAALLRLLDETIATTSGGTVLSAVAEDLDAELSGGLGGVVGRGLPADQITARNLGALAACHRAAQSAEQAMTLQGEAESQLTLARATLSLGRLAAAEVALSRVLSSTALDPHLRAAARVAAARISLGWRDPGGAAQCAAEALECEPGHPEASVLLALAAIRLGERARASQVLAALPRPRQAWPRAPLRELVQAELECGRWAAALDWCRQAGDAAELAALSAMLTTLLSRDAPARSDPVAWRVAGILAYLRADVAGLRQAVAWAEGNAESQAWGCCLRLLAGPPGELPAALVAALESGVLDRVNFAPAFEVPVRDLLTRAAAPGCKALLLAYLGLAPEARAAVAGQPGPDLARIELLLGAPETARQLLERSAGLSGSPELADSRLWLLALAMVRTGAAVQAETLLAERFAAAPSWHAARWLCQVRLEAGHVTDCLAVVEQIWTSEGGERDVILAQFVVRALVAQGLLSQAAALTAQCVQNERSGLPLLVLRGAVEQLLATTPRGVEQLALLEAAHAILAAGPATSALAELAMALHRLAPTPAHLEAAVAALQRSGQGARALALCHDAALGIAPASEVIVLYCDTLLGSGQAEAALAQALELLAHQPLHAGLWHVSSRALLELGRADAAAQAARRALAGLPPAPSSKLALARAELAMGRATEALVLAEEVLAGAALDTAAWTVVLDSIRALGGAAWVARARAATLALPDWAPGFHHLAMASAHASQPRATLAAARRVLALEPGHAGGWQLLLDALAGCGRWAELRAQARACEHAAGPLALAARARAQAELALGAFERSRDEAREAVRREPEHALAWRLLLAAELTLGWLDDARASLDKLGQLGLPGSPRPDLELALALAGADLAAVAGPAAEVLADPMARLRWVAWLATGGTGDDPGPGLDEAAMPALPLWEVLMMRAVSPALATVIEAAKASSGGPAWRRWLLLRGRVCAVDARQLVAMTGDLPSDLLDDSGENPPAAAVE